VSRRQANWAIQSISWHSDMVMCVASPLLQNYPHLAVGEADGQAAGEVGAGQARQQVQHQVVVHQAVGVRLAGEQGNQHGRRLARAGLVSTQTQVLEISWGWPQQEAAVHQAVAVCLARCSGAAARSAAAAAEPRRPGAQQSSMRPLWNAFQRCCRAHLQAAEVVGRGAAAVGAADHGAGLRPRRRLRLPEVQLGVQQRQRQRR
jgi:hypothetical protein